MGKKKQIKFNSDILIKNKETVNIIKLDSYIKYNKIKFIDLIKIDTQGFEERIIRGCKDILKKKIIKFIEIEFIMGNQYKNRLNIIDIEKHLIKNGFRLFGINQSGDLLGKPDMCIDLLYANTKYITIS